MTDAPDPVAPGGTVTYTITVENTGAEDEDNVVIRDTMTGLATIVSTTPSQGYCGPPTAIGVTCTLGTLGPGATAIIIVDKQIWSPVGGIAQVPADGSDSSARAADGSGLSAEGYGAIAGAVVGAAAVAFTIGAWYVRRRSLGHTLDNEG